MERKIHVGLVEHALHDRELVGFPDIILVAKGNEVGPSELHGLHEIVAISEAPFVLMKVNWKECAPGEIEDYGFRAVGGCVVGNDELIGCASLFGEAVQLLRKISFAISRGQGY